MAGRGSSSSSSSRDGTPQRYAFGARMPDGTPSKTPTKRALMFKPGLSSKQSPQDVPIHRFNTMALCTEHVNSVLG